MKTNFFFTSVICNIYLAFLLTLAITSCCSNVSVLANDHKNHDLKQVKVGFVSNFSDRWGAMAHEFVKMAISDFYMKHPKYETRLLLQARDSHSDPVTSAVKVRDLIMKEEVEAIIGPETSQEAQFDISLGEKYRVPIISYSASSPMLSNPYFIQATQDDSSQVKAISSIIQYFGWREVTPVYVDNQFGGGIIPFLVDTLQQSNIRIPYRCVISPMAKDDQIRGELSKLKERQTRVFVVHMDEQLASRVFSLAYESGMMVPEYVWIVTSSISNAFGTLRHEVIQYMHGVLGVQTYVPKWTDKQVQMFNARWGKNVSLHSANLQMSIYGLWAYDATFLLAKAVEQVHQDSNSTSVKVKLGPLLIKKLVNASIDGLSGKFSLVNGKLQTDTFEIINVVGSGEKEIGFWKSKKGLIRDVDGFSNSRSLGNIIWPGDMTKIPRGWAIPTKAKPLKIGVPLKPGFTEFVQASADDSNPTGFCIELFEAVRKKLNYDLPVEYHPSPASYDDLINKVHSKEYDAVVGDVTIIANRALLVDFALPYMESDVLMVVPAVKDIKGSKRIWAFLKPLSWRLWVTTLCFFVLIAIFVWFNEHEINDEFRQNSWRGQIGLYLFYSFSTMVFSNKEVPKSNMVRLVMVLWVFTLLLITQSYTANLASLLTVEKLQPAYTDVKELVRTRKNVGYQKGTFVLKYLQTMGFDKSQMKEYETPQELEELFSKETNGGGIDAAFDEAPYMNLFLSGHCSKYMKVVPPVSRTDGFAFVFQKGSPLVSDISQAVLNITEGETMSNISGRWLNSSYNCPIDYWENQSENTLDLESFAALFAITGGVCVAAIFWKLCLFVYRKRRSVVVQNRSGNESGNGGGLSLRKRLVTKLKGRRVSRSAAVSPDTDTAPTPSSPTSLSV